MALHYATEDFADRGRLARVLGRERAKDTTLDYAEGREPEPDLVRRYAERRGLVPESQIVVRAPERRTGERQAEAPAPRRSRFAGLKLGAGRTAAERALEPPEPAPPGPRMVPSREGAEAAQLTRGLTGYARAWKDAARMEQAGLPVLPHQEAALAQAGQRLEQTRPGLSRDAAAALRRNPELAATGQAAEVALFSQAVSRETQAREQLEERARAVVREWGKLERAYAAAEKDYDWAARREIGERMEAFAKELKRDPQLDSLLRQRGKQLGIADGSRLERVVQAREEDLSHALRRELGVSLGRGLGMGL